MSTSSTTPSFVPNFAFSSQRLQQFRPKQSFLYLLIFSLFRYILQYINFGLSCSPYSQDVIIGPKIFIYFQMHPLDKLRVVSLLVAARQK